MPSVIHVGCIKPNAMRKQSAAKVSSANNWFAFLHANRPMENTEQLRGRVLVFAAKVPNT